MAPEFNLVGVISRDQAVKGELHRRDYFKRAFVVFAEMIIRGANGLRLRTELGVFVANSTPLGWATTRNAMVVCECLVLSNLLFGVKPRYHAGNLIENKGMYAVIEFC